jgi:hypothetical protein
MSPTYGALHPDPAPAPRPVLLQQVATPARSVVVTPPAPVAVRSPALTRVAPVKSRPSHPAQVAHRAAADPRAFDTSPRMVDVPLGLGSVAGPLRDDASALLAALALLAAAAAAASGVALTIVWSRAGAVL